ncbi:hypothetical protein BASA60_006506 [Batrachochytrium salamandrivorans]|nr:hypothetical protein BASA60_006506 [Batrachochytrium salamandrivorans]
MPILTLPRGPSSTAIRPWPLAASPRRVRPPYLSSSTMPSSVTSFAPAPSYSSALRPPPSGPPCLSLSVLSLCISILRASRYSVLRAILVCWRRAYRSAPLGRAPPVLVLRSV